MGDEREENVPKTLGEYFSKLEMSSTEKERIGLLISKQSIPNYIIKTYASKTHGYALFTNHASIDGFRKGRVTEKIALQQIFSHLKVGESKKNRPYWEIYRESAIDYVQAEFKHLNQLVDEISLETVPDPTEALKLACQNADRFSATREDFEKLYNFWWMPRIENVDEIFELVKFQDSDREKEEADKRIFVDVENLKQQYGELFDLVEPISSKVESLIDEQVTLATRIHNVENQVNKLVKTQEEINCALRKGITEEVLESALKELSENQKSDILAHKEALDETRITIEELKNQSLTEFQKIEAIDDKLASLSPLLESKSTRSRATDTENVRSTKYKSPLSLPPIKTPSNFQLTTELEFVNQWVRYLFQEYSISISLEQALIYQGLFLANRCIVAEYLLVKSWLECLNWLQFTMHLSASPMWSTEEDWADGAEFLFTPQTTQPRILIIHSFEAGLPDCYLSPSLKLWTVQQETVTLCKLFLVIGSDHEEELGYPHVLELAAYIPPQDYNKSRDIDIKQDLPVPSPVQNTSLFGVDPIIAEQWLQNDLNLGIYFKDIQSNMGMPLSRDVILNIGKVSGKIEKFIETRSAVSASIYYNLLPWYRALYGDISHTEFISELKQLNYGGYE